MQILEKMIKPQADDKLLDHFTVFKFDQCFHKERSKLLDHTMEWVHKAAAIWEEDPKNKDQLAPGENPDILLSHIRDRAFTAIPQYRMTRARLNLMSRMCKHCNHLRNQAIREQGGEHPLSGRVYNWPIQWRADEDEDRDVEVIEQEEEQLSDEEEEGKESQPRSPQKQLLAAARRLGGDVVEGRKEAVRKSKEIQPYSFYRDISQGVMKTFDLDFDDYFSGPSVEMLALLYTDIITAFDYAPSFAYWSTVGDRFSDHGYRRTAGGFHQFYLNAPSIGDQLAHMFPLPPPSCSEKVEGLEDQAQKRPFLYHQ